MYDYLVNDFVLCFIFFFKQKTAYEMRISDWSSDVCSSDLLLRHLGVSDRLLAECDDGIHDFAAERIGRGHIAHHLAGKGPERAHHIVRKLLQDHAVLTDKGVERTVVLGHELAHQDRKSTRLNSSH